jgi:hypothetical protein
VLNPDIDKQGRLDLIVHGDVMATERASASDRIGLRKELTADSSTWIAVRASGAREVPAQGQVLELGAVAHSAPIYVIVDDQPFWKTAARAAGRRQVRRNPATSDGRALVAGAGASGRHRPRSRRRIRNRRHSPPQHFLRPGSVRAKEGPMDCQNPGASRLWPMM